MTNQWFRSWHGAPTDPKWLGIGRKAGVAPGMVVAIAWALLDRASQATERGSIEGFDADGLGCFLGCGTEQVEAVVEAMHQKGVLENNKFSGWDVRQPKREDGSAERGKEWRERKKAQSEQGQTEPNATERKRTLDTDTDKKERYLSEKISDTPKPKPKKVKADYPESFETFWKAFPNDPGMSKAEAFKVWDKLTEQDQGKAIAAIPAFKVWVSKQGPNYRTLHACRYLSQRRFDGFDDAANVNAAAPKKVFIPENHPAFKAWEIYLGKKCPTTEGRRWPGAPKVRGWYFDSDWPPGYQPTPNSQQTQPEKLQ